jgi:sialic acid synthase SpsE
VLTELNLRIIRPGLGLPPKYFSTLIGKRVGRTVRRGTPMSWDLLTSSDADVATSLQDLSRGARA